MVISRSIHIAAEGIVSFFLWLIKVPLDYVPHLLYSFLHQYIFSLLSCLGYYNSAVMNIEVHAFFELHFSLDTQD